MKTIMAFVLCLLFVTCALAQHNVEKFYQEGTCASLQGKMEVITTSGTRCDCLTPQYAIEYDFAHKWAESVGQSLGYSAHLEMTPGIVLIVEDSKDEHFVEELLYVNERKGLGITIWTVDPQLRMVKKN